jgi:hypothetical protein
MKNRLESMAGVVHRPQSLKVNRDIAATHVVGRIAELESVANHGGQTDR